MLDENNSIDSDRDSFVWKDMLEDDDMISEQEDYEEDLGCSCNDFNWDQRTELSAFSVRFDLEEKDDVSALGLSIDERTTDSTIISVEGDWLSIYTEIEVPGPSKEVYTDMTDDAILLERREQKRSAVMAKMLRLELSLQKFGVELGYSTAD